MEEVRCPVCGNDITEHPDYCPECGFQPLDLSEPFPEVLKPREGEISKMQPYTSICPHCGQRSAADVMFCPYCGVQKAPMPDSYVSRSQDGFDKYVDAEKRDPYGEEGFDKHVFESRRDPYGVDGLDKHPVNKKGTSGKAGILLAAALIVLIAIIVLVILR